MFRRPGVPFRRAACAAALASAVGGWSGLAAPAAATEIKISVRPDGRTVILNEPSEARARRFAEQLVPIPNIALARAIEDHATAKDLDPKLVRAVIQVESGYNPNALSDKGAMGLMQLMPDTATELAVSHPYDVHENLRGGTTYLRRMIDRFRDTALALAAYNAGPEAVDKYGGVPPYEQTRDYVKSVLHLFDGSDPDLAAGRPVHVVRDANHHLLLTTDATIQH